MPAHEPVALPQTLQVEWRDDVAILRLARPEKRNALNDPTVQGIGAFFSNLPEHVKVVLLESGGACAKGSIGGFKVFVLVCGGVRFRCGGLCVRQRHHRNNETERRERVCETVEHERTIGP